MSVENLAWRRLFARPYGAYLAIFSLGSALSAFAAFLVSACMPTAVEDLGHVNLMSWSFTFYLIAAILAGITASPLKWRLGTGAALQCAGGVFLLGSLACTLAPTMWVLLAGRVAQGFGEGAVAGLSYILIPEVFPALMIPAIFGIEATIWAAGSLAGPIIGGFLTQALSWRAAFLIEVPPVLLFMGLVWAVIPEGGRRAEAQHPLPVARIAGVGAGILLLSLAAIEESVRLRALSVGCAILLLVLMAAWDKTTRNRLLPRGAFSLSSRAGLAFWVVLLMPAAHTGPGIYLILFLEQIWAFAPLPAAILGAAMVAAWSGAGILVSRLPAHHARGCLGAGPALLAFGLVLGWVAMDLRSLWLLLSGQALMGIGYGLSWGFLSQVIMSGSAEAERDRASAMLPTVLSAGLAIGAALGGIAANAAGLGDAVPQATVVRAGLWCFAVASIVGLAGLAMALRLQGLMRAPSAA